jgi:hypothetical protein
MHGVPEFVISDNGPQYSSCEYRKFSDEWNFQHHTSSPHYPKRNGTAEAAVKQAKRIFKMSKDPWLAILEQRNTPDELASPNEKLMSRLYRLNLHQSRVLSLTNYRVSSHQQLEDQDAIENLISSSRTLFYTNRR